MASSGWTVAIREADWHTLVSMAGLGREAAAVITARVLKRGDNGVLLVRTIYPIPKDAYLKQSANALTLASSGYVPALGAAASDGAVALFFHTHPAGRPTPSIHDAKVDLLLADLFGWRTKSGSYGSLILGGTPEVPEVTGRFAFEGGDLREIASVRIVGRRLQIVPGYGQDPDVLPVFDRQIRAFGARGQQILRSMHVGVVGAGGTGSSVAQQLVRLGVGRLTLVDFDLLEESNVSRVYGAGRQDVGQAKADVVARYLRSLGLPTVIESVVGSVTNQVSAEAISTVDAVFGCTDDNAGRAVLSRLAYACLVPLIDMGFIVDTDGRRVRGLFGRVSYVAPGTACLICRGRISLKAARAEMLPAEERSRLQAQGYVPGLAEPNPSVVSYTTTVAGLAVSDLLDRLFGIGASHDELLLQLHEWRLGRTSRVGLEGHYCTDNSFVGRGSERPFLGQLWTTAT